MKKIKAIALKPYLLIFFCVCAVIALSAFNLNSFKASAYKKRSNSQVTTFLKGLEITQVKELIPSLIQVIIKNNYPKDITAVVATSPGKFFRTDYIFAEMEKDQKLAPGASDEFVYNLNPGENAVISAVLFADKLGDGNAIDIQCILDRRLGMKTQLARINPYLERLNHTDIRLIQTELQSMKRVFENLPIEKDDKSPMSEDFEYGLRDGRTDILMDLSEFEAVMGGYKTENNIRDQQPASEIPYDKSPKRFARRCSHYKNLERRL